MIKQGRLAAAGRSEQGVAPPAPTRGHCPNRVVLGPRRRAVAGAKFWQMDLGHQANPRHGARGPDQRPWLSNTNSLWGGYNANRSVDVVLMHPRKMQHHRKCSLRNAGRFPSHDLATSQSPPAQGRRRCSAQADMAGRTPKRNRLAMGRKSTLAEVHEIGEAHSLPLMRPHQVTAVRRTTRPASRLRWW